MTNVDLHGKIGKYPVWMVGTVVAVGVLGFMWWRSHHVAATAPAPAATPPAHAAKGKQGKTGAKGDPGKDGGTVPPPDGKTEEGFTSQGEPLTAFAGVDYDYPGHTASHPLDYMTDVVGGNVLIHPDTPHRRHELVGYNHGEIDTARQR